ncbi:hypothetical protein FOL47_002213 [Perkinsus chesapeaki]|uniref:Uncharacterized protein n=1 Tax=Perkinsus chesapeaki TaxID=330153 RepID=A0A7J6MEW3_PERCH|nr:hypothetical protein FOL47_002213 [Perkinsus chesapeaki]
MATVTTSSVEVSQSSTRGTILITGASAGVGMEAAKVLMKDGWHVVAAVRNVEKGRRALGDQAEVMECDLANFDSVVKFAKEFKKRYNKLDRLVLNAGVYIRTKTPTIDGLDETWQSNFLSHFLLTMLLLPVIRAADNPAVIMLSSVSHRLVEPYSLGEHMGKPEGYTKEQVYYGSKYSMTVFAFELARLTGLRTVAANPGGVDSDIWRERSWFLRCLSATAFLTAREGAQTTIVACNDPLADKYLSPYPVVQCCGSFIAIMTDLVVPRFMLYFYKKFKWALGPDAKHLRTRVGYRARDPKAWGYVWEEATKILSSKVKPEVWAEAMKNLDDARVNNEANAES